MAGQSKAGDVMVDYTESQKKIIATAHTAVAFVVVVALVAMAAWLFLKGLSIASRAVIPVVTGFFLALFFKPYYLWLEKKVRIPVVALLLLVMTVLLPIGLLVWWAGAVIVNEIVGLVKQIPVMMGQALERIESSFPNLHSVLGQLKLACGRLADAISNLVGTATSVETSAMEASGGQVAAACANYGETISNVVASASNVDTAKMVEFYTNCSQTVNETLSHVVQAGEEAVGAAANAVSTNCDASTAQATVGGFNLNTEKLGELYATYGDQIKKVGANIIQAGYDKFGHAAAGAGETAVAAATSAGASAAGAGAAGAGAGETAVAVATSAASNAASAGGGAQGWVSGASSVVTKVGAGVVGILKGIFYVLVTTIFFVYFLMSKNCQGGKIADAIPLLSDKTRSLVASQIDTLIEILVSFYQRQVLICLVEGCFYGVGFWLIGLPYGFFIGFLLGALNLIPFFGSIVCLPIAIVFACFGTGGSGLRVILVLVVWGIGQVLNGYCITPKIQGDRTGFGYAGMIFSFLFWTLFLGPLLGLLLAIPLSACCVVLWRTFCKLTRPDGIL